ncbi:MAG: helix-turn-helix domain-containing protein [Rhizobiales bacterium]|nr:helix-turn-helix domain-containing protein [Hyphomicrobiales bacterium]
MTEKLRYDYTGDQRLLEGADWFGAFHGLRPHFHDEIQVSFLEHGQRDYLIDVHRAMPSSDIMVRSTEFYLAPSELPETAVAWIERQAYVIADAPWLVDTPADDVPPAVLDTAATLNPQCVVTKESSRAPTPDRQFLDLPLGVQIAEIASARNLTREAYIRAFTRRFGMTPHAYRVNLRLNEGRALLRQGYAIADVAAAAGFSDQSHFGRSFLACFGATPGQFRAAHSQR